MEQVAARKVGESGTYYFRQAVWSALMISSAINTMMILVESGPSLSLMFTSIKYLFGSYVVMYFQSYSYNDSNFSLFPLSSPGFIVNLSVRLFFTAVISK